MRTLKSLLDNNKKWSENIRNHQPDFFENLSTLQAPEYLWIGCSDSRVPANQIVGLQPGGIFVHRNVANVVVHTDLNCLSVMQFAVDVLKIKHIIVCGHYGCGGVIAALEDRRLGLIDNWLRHIQDVAHKHTKTLNEIKEFPARADRLCELNVLEQALNVCQTTIIQDAWARGHGISVHGWIYGIQNGLLKDLNFCVTNANELNDCYGKAIASLA